MEPAYLFPFLLLQLVSGDSDFLDLETVNFDSCSNDTCGENAECFRIEGNPVCSCPQGYQGDPLSYCTSTECVLNSDCPEHLSCINNKCTYPCFGTCGLDALCNIINHIPTCLCPPGYTGDPYRTCRRFEPSTTNVSSCSNETCGENAECSLYASGPQCICLRGYSGDPLTSCKRAECLNEEQCPVHLTCRGGRCTNPCDGACPPNTVCSGQHHLAVCSCQEGYSGNPYRSCQPSDPSNIPSCSNRTCGENAECSIVNGRPLCTCLRGYSGDPSVSCKRPECLTNSECPSNRTCLYNKCRSPCDGTCGLDALCEVINHAPICSCLEDYTGNPFTHCRRLYSMPNVSSCSNATCGENAQCFESDGHVECSCDHRYLGDPLIPCKKVECLDNSECSDHLSCRNGKCVDSCDGFSCGQNAVCNVKSHKPQCSCPGGYFGRPSIRCFEYVPL